MNRDRLLVTGFGSFGDIGENPTAVLARHVHPDAPVLEVSFRAVDAFLTSVAPDSFDAWLMLGVAAGAGTMRMEQVGRNWIGTTPDIEGVVAYGKIDPAGPPRLASSLWIDAGLEEEERLVYSQDAGLYLCNYLLYRGLRAFPDKPVGFLHVPTFQDDSEENQKTALTRIVDEILERL